MKKITVITSLYRCEKYLNGFFTYANRVKNSNEIEFLLIHNDPLPEEVEIIRRNIFDKNSFRYIEVKERESLYSTWNRGVKLATGQYIAIWNVDDSRLPDSLSAQAEKLDKTPDAAMTYGDYYLSPVPHKMEGRIIHEPDYTNETKNEFRCSHFVGCFPMWRKIIHDKIGYFDEQFSLVADYEFQVRVAYRYGFAKTNMVLGSFFKGTGSENRLSQNAMKQNRERTAVEIRYGIYYKTILPLWNAAKNTYDISTITSFGVKHRITDYIPELPESNKRKRFQIIRAATSIPRYFAMKMMGRSI